MEKENGTVAELHRLLGEPVVFLRCPKGSKKPKGKWGHLRPKQMTPAYLSKLPVGNIGVALGKVSGGLCAIDIDADELVEPFLAVNPQLRDTLQTHGARGRVFWIRVIGEYPCPCEMNTLDGKHAGEFRSTGNQSIIWGIHPDTQQDYEFVVKKPVVPLAFNSLRWPPEISNPPKTGECTEETEEQKRQKNRGTEELKSCVEGVRPHFHSTINSIEDALRVSMPNKKRENNALLFKLARAIKTLEVKGEKFDLARLESIFSEWHRRSEKFLREGQSREEYYLEFMNACERAKFPLGGVKVAEAWEKANSQPLPSEAMRFENPKLCLFVAFLKQLQEMAGAEPFFLTSRDGAHFLQLESHSIVDKWFGALRKLGYIKVAQPGNEHRATRYFYIWLP